MSGKNRVPNDVGGWDLELSVPPVDGLRHDVQEQARKIALEQLREWRKIRSEPVDRVAVPIQSGGLAGGSHTDFVFFSPSALGLGETYGNDETGATDSERRGDDLSGSGSVRSGRPVESTGDRGELPAGRTPGYLDNLFDGLAGSQTGQRFGMDGDPSGRSPHTGIGQELAGTPERTGRSPDEPDLRAGRFDVGNGSAGGGNGTDARSPLGAAGNPEDHEETPASAESPGRTPGSEPEPADVAAGIPTGGIRPSGRLGDDVAGAGDAGISGTGPDDGQSGGRGSGGRGDDAGGLADNDSEEGGTEEEDGVAPLQGGEGDAEDLPPLPKDPLAEVPLTAFFDLNFEHAVNHRRGVDGSDQRGQKQKARDNLQAIRLLKTCVAENHAPTPAEQQKIALFYGFGGLPYAFRRPNGKIESGWSDVALELEALTTEDELKSLRARTVDAQYTSDAVVSAIWDTVRQALLPDDLLHPDEPLAGEQPPAGVQPHAGAQPLQVLEPAVGSGVFLSLAPADVPMEFLAVEMDPITATVTKALHPHENIFNAPFQKVKFAETVDVVVGNPPFGRSKLLDMDRPDLTRVSPNTHGYFFAKSLDRLRPGGIAIMVVSRYLLDADMPEYRAFRVWLHNQAELVSAVRLPHTVFS
ncbi:MAG: hypothetical protein GJU67_00970, partial [Ferrovum sp.]|nr:hypothetical protein [Ferrovum sp.]